MESAHTDEVVTLGQETVMVSPTSRNITVNYTTALPDTYYNTQTRWLIIYGVIGIVQGMDNKWI